MANSRKQGPTFTATLAVLWRTFRRDAFDPYRPELHYMRGPGPKWRAKHAMPAPDVAPELVKGTTFAAR